MSAISKAEITFVFFRYLLCIFIQEQNKLDYNRNLLLVGLLMNNITQEMKYYGYAFCTSAKRIERTNGHDIACV